MATHTKFASDDEVDVKAEENTKKKDKGESSSKEKDREESSSKEEKKKKKDRSDRERDEERKDKSKREESRDDRRRDEGRGRRDDVKDGRDDGRGGGGGGRDQWGGGRRNEWNRGNDRGGRDDQWRRDRDQRADRSGQGGWGKGNGGGRKDWQGRKREEPDPRDNDPSRPAWATGKVMDRAKELKDRKLLWKKSGEGDEEASSSTAVETNTEEKNAGMWSAAFTAASGGDSTQSAKFMKLMGIKKAPVTTQNTDDQVEEERAKQNALMRGLEKQYEVSREFSHFGRGKGLGFHE